jgi:hypothetical protein
LVHDVIAAIATAPWSSSNFVPSSSVTIAGLLGRPPSWGAADRWSSGAAEPLPVWDGESDAGKDSATDSSYPCSSSCT